ncbi:hypothetical protein OHU17_11945 [Streptomyces goshikiensis]|uniref:Uncharacterized protein n=1 Tax=Streptomyces goshikiensis TaxID=1942 RepID=A0ABZ1RJK0_9ACTN|nr:MULTISPECIES: hypothetical protein [Streptomyces]RPK45587.1 hypothetical protein EES37_14390 [Streptomyces sp. ADI91-18]WBY22155.1 hypothetical protein PET44_22545 [Streptomyces goshikiensis]WSS00929.1 hypothetical protein OG224_24425 [Streptomyces goshikiensis]WSX98003.1 hypothetical protein OG590_12505 [Streptomyces goshikiensis]GHD56809.1 hypothetical protein GCM10010336_03060 [Streptomyces goshikiensis]
MRSKIAACVGVLTVALVLGTAAVPRPSGAEVRAIEVGPAVSPR